MDDRVNMVSLKLKKVSRVLPTVGVRIIKLRKSHLVLGEVDDGVQAAGEGEEVGDEGFKWRTPSEEELSDHWARLRKGMMLD